MLVNTAGPFAALITSTFNIEHATLAGRRCKNAHRDLFGAELHSIGLKLDLVAVVPTLFAARAVSEADTYHQQALMRRRRRILFRDTVLALIIALMVFGAWKVIALAFALGPP
jgi:hypothetical protein